jgi:hypothetical protein
MIILPREFPQKSINTLNVITGKALAQTPDTETPALGEAGNKSVL